MAGFPGSEVLEEGPDGGGVSRHRVEVVTGATASDAGDGVPPVITLLSPAEGELPSRATPVVIRVTDDRRVSLVSAKFTYDGNAQPMVAYDIDGVAATFAGSSALVALAQVDLSLRPMSGWEANVVLRIAAIDAGGNITTATFSWSVPDPIPVVVSETRMAGQGGLGFALD